jgi:7-cyano-7-deazaguanine synthase
MPTCSIKQALALPVPEARRPITTLTPTAASAPAVVLLSGGLDSATVLAVARREGLVCHALAFDYGQRHRHELVAAARIAEHLGAASFRVFPLDLRAFGGSALTDDAIAVPKDRADETIAAGIPSTYVPARNLVFLSLATAYAEALGARDLCIGVNAVDYSGYPDCRPEFIASFARTAGLATKIGVEAAMDQDDGAFRIRTPLIDLSKADIIRLGHSLGVDYSLTHSCYDPVLRNEAVLACGRCDSCRIRARGFAEAGVADPTRYAEPPK